MADQSSKVAPAIELSGISKSFGPVQANKDIDLVVEKGTIHGIIGENGAGKSTLMSILYGFYQADSGTISINGKAIKIPDSQAAIAAGIGMVHQHFMLVQNFSVLENVILGAEGGPILNQGIARAKAELQRLEEDYALDVDIDALIEDLPVGLQQRVEILKDGASSIYGSDAIGGVINYITRKGDGGEFNAYTQFAEESGGETLQINASYGRESDKGYWRVTADYNKQEQILKGDRLIEGPAGGNDGAALEGDPRIEVRPHSGDLLDLLGGDPDLALPLVVELENAVGRVVDQVELFVVVEGDPAQELDSVRNRFRDLLPRQENGGHTFRGDLVNGIGSRIDDDEAPVRSAGDVRSELPELPTTPRRRSRR